MKAPVLSTVTAALALSACGMPMPGSHFQSAVLPRAVRELSDAEKVSLARSLPVNFKEPNSAKFRWLPVTFCVTTTPKRDAIWAITAPAPGRLRPTRRDQR